MTTFNNKSFNVVEINDSEQNQIHGGWVPIVLGIGKALGLGALTGAGTVIGKAFMEGFLEDPC